MLALLAAFLATLLRLRSIPGDPKTRLPAVLVGGLSIASLHGWTRRRHERPLDRAGVGRPDVPPTLAAAVLEAAAASGAEPAAG
jgi:hypothetical protein